MNMFLWIVITIGLYFSYRFIYQKYLDSFLYKEESQESRWKLPTLRQCVFSWIVLSMVMLLLFNASNERDTSELCNAFYTEEETNSSFVDAAGFEEGFQEYQRQAKEKEQLNVSYKQLADGVELIASQNQEGLVFVAIRVKREIQENEYYVFSIHDEHRGDGYSIQLKNTGYIGMYSVRAEPLTDCEAFILDIQVYNMTDKENTNPISIQEQFRIDKVVSIQ